MKKVLALVLSTLMMLSMLAFLMVPAAAEVEGPFVVYSNASEYRDDFDPENQEYSPVPGYYYDENGLHTTSPDWSKHTPALGIQTRGTVNLKEGVYMQVRIDKFTYVAEADMWMCFNIYDTQYVNVGSPNAEKDGTGLTVLMRPGVGEDGKGKIYLAQWMYNNFVFEEGDDFMHTYDGNDASHYDEDGNLLLEFVVSWDEANSTYVVTYNGAAAPDQTIAWLNTKFGEDDRAYVGFNAQHKNQGGELEVSVLKWGKDKATAEAPYGEDGEDASNVDKTIAEPADPSTVPEGQPAIFMNGSKEASDSKSTIKDDGGLATLTPENYAHYVSDRAIVEVPFAPKNEVSYNIEDFPIIVVLTKNLCTCESPDGICYATENCDMYVMSGEHVAAGANCLVSMINVCYEPIVVGEDSYLWFYVDAANDPITFTAEGRFHGARFDVRDIKFEEVGRNTFDVCFMALFRTVDEAEAYILEYVGANDVPVDTDTDVATDSAETEGTETPEDTQTEVQTPVESEPDTDEQKPVESEPETNVQNPDDTDKQPEGSEAETEGEEEAGCASAVGFGAVAIVAIATAAGFVAFKKKD